MRTRGIADRPRGASKEKRQRGNLADRTYKGYEGDAAITKLRKHGATEGWLVEVYPALGCESERWFMKVQDGSTYTSPEGNRMIKELVWLKLGSLTKVDKKFDPESLDIEWARAYGEPAYFTLNDTQ